MPNIESDWCHLTSHPAKSELTTGYDIITKADLEPYQLPGSGTTHITLEDIAELDASRNVWAEFGKFALARMYKWARGGAVISTAGIGPGAGLRLWRGEEASNSKRV